MIDIIANIEAIRQEKGIKQSEMGRRLGTTQSGYSNFVNRNTDMPFSRISQIADILGVSVVDIVTYPDKYVPEDQVAAPVCEECQKKQETIDNLNELLREYKQKLKNKK